MTQEELALAVAEQIGKDLFLETQRVVAGNGSLGRDFGSAELIAASGLVLSCAQFAFQIWKDTKDKTKTTEQLYYKIKCPKEVAEELRLEIISKTIVSLQSNTKSIEDNVAREDNSQKAEWVNKWSENTQNHHSGEKREFHSAAILLHFSDKFYCLFRPFKWSAPEKNNIECPEIVVPKGFVTDLASIPRVFWSVASPTGWHGYAAILHDWLYWDQSVDRETADRIFDIAMKELAVSTALRKTMFSAVRVFGQKAWNDNANNKKEGQRRILTKFPDNPKVSWNEWRTNPDVFA